MQPSFDLRIRSMIKALAEIVLPALPPEREMAREQGQIVLGSLELIRQQVDHAHWFEAVDLLSLCELGHALLAIEDLDAPPTLRESIEQAARLAQRWNVADLFLRQASGELRELIDQSVATAFVSGSIEMRGRVQRLVLEHAREASARERAFLAGAGWDPDSGSMNLEESLNAASVAAGTE